MDTLSFLLQARINLLVFQAFPIFPPYLIALLPLQTVNGFFFMSPLVVRRFHREYDTSPTLFFFFIIAI